MSEQLDLDKILTAKEQEHAGLLERAADVARDIDNLKRIRAEFLGSAATPPEPALASPPEIQATVTLPAVASQHNPETQIKPKQQGGWRFEEKFDGTFSGLVRRYRQESRSPYFQLHWKVRKNYDLAINRMMHQLASERITNLTETRIQGLYDGWKTGGKIATAHMYITKLRLLISFGANNLNDDACIKVGHTISQMAFELPEARNERLTADQAVAIRIKAHELGRPSIALAQALQFDLKIKQVEVIGEWVPLNEEGDDDIIWDDQKWARGLRWSEIDANLILRHTSKVRGSKDIESDLNNCPMVKEELNLINGSERSGPLIICEWTGKPWKAAEFRRWWRKVADAANVPKEVRNMDNRPEPVIPDKLPDLENLPDNKGIFN